MRDLFSINSNADSLSPPGENAVVSSACVSSGAGETTATTPVVIANSVSVVATDCSQPPVAATDTSLPREVVAAAARGIVRNENSIEAAAADFTAAMLAEFPGTVVERLVVNGVEIDPLDIPAFLKRDANNVAPCFADRNVTTSRTFAAMAITSADELSKPDSLNSEV